jgi:ComF family protein
MVYKWLNYNLSRWFPQSCVLCGQDSASSALCRRCRDDLPRLTEPCCQQCGLPLSAATQTRICGQCLQHPPHYQRVISALAYASPAAELVTALKFQQRIALARILGELLAERVRSTGHSCQAILPVPLHPRRIAERGFNQALEIARPLARSLELPLLTHAVYRRRHTAAQSAQGPDQRQRNVRGAFAVNLPHGA